MSNAGKISIGWGIVCAVVGFCTLVGGSVSIAIYNSHLYNYNDEEYSAFGEVLTVSANSSDEFYFKGEPNSVYIFSVSYGNEVDYLIGTKLSSEAGTGSSATITLNSNEEDITIDVTNNNDFDIQFTVY